MIDVRCLKSLGAYMHYSHQLEASGVMFSTLAVLLDFNLACFELLIKQLLGCLDFGLFDRCWFGPGVLYNGVSLFLQLGAFLQIANELGIIFLEPD